MNEKILVLDAGSNAGLAFIRSLGMNSDCVVIAADCSENAAGFYSKYCTAHYIYPSPLHSRTRFQDTLERLLLETKPSLLFPMSDQTIDSLLEIRERIERHCPIAVGDGDQYHALSDKRSLMGMAAANGLPAPKTVILEPGQRVPDLFQHNQKKVVIKPYRSVIGVRDSGFKPRVTYATRYCQLEEAVRQLHSLNVVVLLQEFVDGVERGYFCLTRKGQLLVEFQHQRIRDKNPRGSGSCLRKGTEIDPRLRKVAKKVLGAVQWSGLVMFEFIDPLESHPLLIEVNARPWGSMHLPIASGIDFPYLYYCQLKNRPLARTNVVTEKKVRWLLGDIKHVEASIRDLRRNRSIPNLVQTSARLIKLLNPFDLVVTYDDFSHRDPRPGLRAIHQHFAKKIGRSNLTVAKDWWGMLHLHSTFSFDGKLELEEYKARYRHTGLSFLILTEHQESFDEGSYRDYVHKCHELSEDDFLMIPALEVRDVNNHHILALNTQKRIQSVTFSDIVDEIHTHGGLAVWAHPYKPVEPKMPTLAEMKKLDGVEIWNLKSDKWAGPKPRTLRLFQRLQAEKSVFPTVGMDLHKTLHSPILRISVPAESTLTPTNLFANFQEVRCWYKERPLKAEAKWGLAPVLSIRSAGFHFMRRLRWASWLWRYFRAWQY